MASKMAPQKIQQSLSKLSKRFGGAVVDVAMFGPAGRGIRVKRPVKMGEQLCSIPVSECFSVQTAKNGLPDFCALFDDTHVLVIYILMERHKGQSSIHADHIATLPVTYDSALFWSHEEIALLEGSSCQVKVTKLQQQTVEDYHKLVESIKAVNKEEALVILGVLNLDAYKWALATVWSRFMDFPTDLGKTIRIGVPFADMFNHERKAGLVHQYDPINQVVKVVAAADYMADDEACINYGSCAPNEKLLLFYGFVDPGNSASAVELYVPPLISSLGGHTSERAFISGEIAKYAEQKGVENVLGPIFKLQLDNPIPRGLLCCLRIRQLQPFEVKAIIRQFHEMDRDKLSKVLDGLLDGGQDLVLETQVLQTLQNVIQKMAQAYPSSPKIDESLLETKLSWRHRMAIILCLEEKTILHRALDELQKRLREFETLKADNIYSGSEALCPDKNSEIINDITNGQRLDCRMKIGQLFGYWCQGELLGAVVRNLQGQRVHFEYTSDDESDSTDIESDRIVTDLATTKIGSVLDD